MKQESFRSAKKDLMNEDWDKRKIAITLLVLGVLLVGVIEGKNFIFGKDDSVLSTQTISAPKSLPSPPKVDIQQGLEAKVKDITKDVETLNFVEVASSSPQIQKVLNDIRGLKDYPRNQAKDMCVKICNNL